MCRSMRTAPVPAPVRLSRLGANPLRAAATIGRLPASACLPFQARGKAPDRRRLHPRVRPLRNGRRSIRSASAATAPTASAGTAPRRAAPRTPAARPAAHGAEPELRQEIDPALARRERQRVRERHEHAPGTARRTARAGTFTSPAPRNENPLPRLSPSKIWYPAAIHSSTMPISHDVRRLRVRRVHERRQQPRARQREQHAERAHERDGQHDDRVAEPARPVAIARADRLADQRRAGERDADARHVRHRRQHHDDLRGRAIDRRSAAPASAGTAPCRTGRRRTSRPSAGRVDTAARGCPGPGATSGATCTSCAVPCPGTPTAQQPTPHTMLTLVAHAEPAMPPSSSKMKSQFSAAFTTATRPVVITAMRGREMPLKKPSTAHNATPSGAPSMRGCQNAIACADTSGARPNGANSSGPDHASNAKKGSVSALAAERDPGGVARAREAPAAFGLRHERLHREPDAADQHQEQQHDPVDRGHAGHRGRRDVADEPGVGEADHRLQAAVEHQRQRQRRDRAIVDDGAPRGGITLLCRQWIARRRRDGVRPGRRRVGCGHGLARITGACAGARKNSRASPGTRAGRPPTA